MSCSDSLGSLLDGFGAGEGLDSVDDIMMNNWDQPGVDASQFGTPHNHGVFNPGSMHVEPPQLPPHQGSFLDKSSFGWMISCVGISQKRAHCSLRHLLVMHH